MTKSIAIPETLYYNYASNEMRKVLFLWRNKQMKKILAIVLMLTMVFAFAACGSEEATTDEGTESADTLIMATNAEFPPYEYYEGGEIVGIDAEIGAAIADKLGMEFQIEDMEFNSIIAAVQSGKASMGMAGMTVTEERQQSVNFTDTYAQGVQVVIVAEGSEITTVDDLFAEGHDWKVGVQESTTGDIYATGDIEDAGLGTIERYNKGADAVNALLGGKIDCVIIDNQPAQAFVEANEGLSILDTEYAVEDYAICIAKNNEDLLEKVNAALQELIADGTVQSIIDKYITAE